MNEVERLTLELAELVRQRDTASSNKYNYSKNGLSTKQFEDEIKALRPQIADLRSRIKRLKKQS